MRVLELREKYPKICHLGLVNGEPLESSKCQARPSPKLSTDRPDWSTRNTIAFTSFPEADY